MNQEIYRITDPSFGKLGFIVFDSRFEGRSVGGVRILPDVTEREVAAMARTMSRKYLFSGIPCGGAKAGLVLRGRAAADRQGALRAFGRALSGHIRSGFWPGADMGSDLSDISELLRGAGIPSLGQGSNTEGYTAMGVIHSIDALLEHSGRGWAGLSMSIDGFGKVGSSIAQMAEARGASIVAVSNTSGSLVDPRGLDVSALIGLRRLHGSGFIRRYPGLGTGPKEKALTTLCDVLVPSARCWSINRANLHRIKAWGIVPAANVPMSLEAERSLWRKKKLIVPDGMSNCGGAVGGTLARFYDESAIGELFRRRFCPRVHAMLGSGRQPSSWLDVHCARMRASLADALIMRKRDGLRELASHLSYHLLDPVLGGSRIVSGLFPV